MNCRINQDKNHPLKAVWQVVPQAAQSDFHLAVYEADLPAIRFYERVSGINVRREEHDNPGGGWAISLRYAWKTAADLQ